MQAILFTSLLWLRLFRLFCHQMPKPGQQCLNLVTTFICLAVFYVMLEAPSWLRSRSWFMPERLWF